MTNAVPLSAVPLSAGVVPYHSPYTINRGLNWPFNEGDCVLGPWRFDVQCLYPRTYSEN